ncbi:MAG: hypothetical protein WCF16_01185 [Alphaproteobacteria bacterium]
MIRISAIRFAAFAAAVGAAALFGAGTAFALTWDEVITMATEKGKPGVSMEMAHDFSTRDKQFAGFAPWVDQYLAEIDTDGDHMISMAEMKKWMIEHKMSNDDLVKVWYKQ